MRDDAFACACVLGSEVLAGENYPTNQLLSRLAIPILEMVRGTSRDMERC